MSRNVAFLRRTRHIHTVQRSHFSATPALGNTQGSRESGQVEEKNLTSVQKLQRLWKKYGVLTVVTYLSVYASTLSGIFFALDFDLFNAATFGLDTTTLINMVLYDLVCIFCNNITELQFLVIVVLR